MNEFCNQNENKGLEGGKSSLIPNAQESEQARQLVKSLCDSMTNENKGGENNG